MSNFSKVLNDEVRRLARKEIRSVLEKSHVDIAGLKRINRDLAKRVAQLEQKNKKLIKAIDRQSPKETEASAEFPLIRVSGKRVRVLRSKLKLSREAFAKLLGVSAPTIYLWEKSDGRLALQSRTLRAFSGIVGLGPREAQRRLAEIEEKGAGTSSKKGSAKKS